MLSNLVIEDYNHLSFVVRDCNGYYGDELKQLGGRWNTNLFGGPGWIFSKRRHEIRVKNWIANRSFNTEAKIIVGGLCVYGFFALICYLGFS
jgi:hypothetical protein